MLKIRAFDIDFALTCRVIDGIWHVGCAMYHPRTDYRGFTFPVHNPKRWGVICAIAFVLVASGTVHAAGTHTVASHTVSAHTVQSHTVREHTVREHTATSHTTGNTWTVRAHTVKAHTVRAYTVATHTVRAHTARNPSHGSAAAHA